MLQMNGPESTAIHASLVDLRHYLVLAAELSLLFFWALFCRVILPDLVSAAVSALVERTTLRLHTEPWQLTAKQRVDHILCDSDDAFIESIGSLLGVGFFVLPLSVFGWLPTSEDIWAPVLWCLRLVSPGILLLCCVGTIRAIVRAGYRKRILISLNAERDRMDPHSTHPKIFVSRRDSKQLARDLFDRITVACYQRAMTVLQYSDFVWPYYEKRWPAQGLHPDAPPQEYSAALPNPNAVRAASILVWLDVGETSQAMQLELDAARQTRIPVVRLQRSTVGPMSFVVSQGPRVYGTATLEAVAQLVVSALEENLGAQPSHG